jgi:hypothetical protein
MTKNKSEKETISFSEEWITKSKKKRLPLYIIIPGTILVFVIVLGVGGYFFIQYQQAKTLLGDKSSNPVSATQSLIENVGKLMVLPTNETPQIATVTDITKLANQPFFKDARNGDSVLIYTKNQEAIIYDPASNKIVTVGPISIKSQTQAVAGAAITPIPTLAPVNVVIYNGTSVVGLAKTIQQNLSKDMTNVTVVATANAAKQTYQQTLVVPLDTSNQQNAEKLASLLHGIIGSMPAGEIKPTNVGILVILGKQQ